MRYSEQILKHFFNPKNVGSFESNEDGIGKGMVGNYENGAVIHFYIKVVDSIIESAKFKAYGNGVIIATCSYATQWVINKSLDEAMQLTSINLINELGIPEIKLHCALLVEDALKAAIENCPKRFKNQGFGHVLGNEL